MTGAAVLGRVRCWRGLLCLASLLAATGCSTFDDRYVCVRDDQCVDPSRAGDAAPAGLIGRCVESACAWPDTGCGTGLRFDPSAGDERAGQCAPQEGLPDMASRVVDASLDPG